MAQPATTIDTHNTRDRRDDVDPVGEAAAGLVGLLWSATTGIFTIVGGACWAILHAIYVLLRASLTGRHRAQIAPAWLAAAAVLCTWAGGPTIGWYWLTVALAVDASTWGTRSLKARRRAVLSIRERRLLACVLAVIAAVLDLTPAAGLVWYWPAGAVTAVVLAGAVPWWRGRRTRNTKAVILARWENEVVAHDDRFAGDWVEFNEDAGTGVLELTNAPASQVATLDERAEWLLNEPAGTVTLTADPRLSRRRIRVTFAEPGDAGRFRYWEGPTLTPDGRITVLYAAGNQPLYGTLWTKAGASFIAIVAPPGSGKGSIQRLLILEAALCPDIFTVGIDGKRGKGLGYCRDGFAVFADTPKKWAQTLDMLIAETERRSALPDTTDSFVLRPGNPRVFTAIDDLPEVLAACPAAAKQLNRQSAQDRSLGKGYAVAMQKGDAPSYGGATVGTTTRSNTLGNGWMWAGPTDDSQARQALKQSFPFDPSVIPPAPGWAAIMGKHLGDQPIVPGRTLWIPNRVDVEEHGMEAPFGTVEDWLERDTVHPQLCDEMKAIFFPQATVPSIVADPVTEPRTTIFDSTVRPAAPQEPTPATEADGRTRILELLRAYPEGLLRGDIAKAVGLTPKHTSDLLRVLSQESLVVQRIAKGVWQVAS